MRTKEGKTIKEETEEERINTETKNKTKKQMIRKKQ